MRITSRTGGSRGEQDKLHTSVAELLGWRAASLSGGLCHAARFDAQDQKRVVPIDARLFRITP